LESKPLDLEILESKPLDLEILESKPLDLEILESKPLDLEILESKPLDLEILESKPLDLEILESKPLDLEILESKPLDLEVFDSKVHNPNSFGLDSNIIFLNLMAGGFATPSSTIHNSQFAIKLVSKVTHSGKYHRYPMLIRRCYHLTITHRATRFNYSTNPHFSRRINSISEWEKSI